MPKRILLVDPSQEQREALEIAVDPSTWTVSTVADAAAARTALERSRFDVAFCDGSIPGLDGFDLAPQLVRMQPDLAVVLIFDRNTPDRFELARRLEATASVGRPFEPAEVSFALDLVDRHSSLLSRSALLETELTRAVGEKPIVGASESMIELLEGLERAAGFKTPTTLVGERGTHREVLARTIHSQSVRRRAPFVAVRCRETDPIAVERRLFGSPDAKGRAGDIAVADGGTVFIDDVSALSASAQERLLRLIETDELLAVGSDKPSHVDVRILAASTRSPQEGLENLGIEPVLAERLFGVTLVVPPLRERIGDVPLLVDHLIARFQSDLGVDVVSVSDTAMERLTHYGWPGNLRELENVVERAMLLAQSDRITLNELPAAVATALPMADGNTKTDFSLRRARRSFEADMIRRALQQTDGNRTRAARLLEISHRALLYKIKEYGLRD